MSSHPLDSGPAGKTVINCVEITGGQNEALAKLIETIDNKLEKERLVILCENKNSRNLVLSLLKKSIKSCIFINDICKDTVTVSREKAQFEKIKVAVCSYNALLNISMPLVEKYVFYEFPGTKKSYLPKVLECIEASALKEGRVPQIDMLFSLEDERTTIQAFYLEMKSRQVNIPISLEEFVVKEFATAEVREKYFAKVAEQEQSQQEKSHQENVNQQEIESATDTTGSAGSSFICNSYDNGTPARQEPVAKPKVVEPPFDVWNMVPNEEGKYVIPGHLIAPRHTGSDDDSYEGQEEDDDDSYEYNYEDEMYEDEYCDI